ncbi:Hypothetical_protein [Hexamita inflata]|uniref:Hypothetical_protein n=1 Tax=Hexamita inflata TaxID=28002 RepID=A0AA86PGB1_9EUKA|nr:Hypothetical protein HINF_LOCUS26091 [Hexamita inflata]
MLNFTDFKDFIKSNLQNDYIQLSVGLSLLISLYWGSNTILLINKVRLLVRGHSTFSQMFDNKCNKTYKEKDEHKYYCTGQKAILQIFEEGSFTFRYSSISSLSDKNI